MSDAQETGGRLVRAEDHLGIVRSVVYKYCRKGRIEDSELYSIGCLALVEAARTYDPSKSKFCTWATRIVRQRVIDEVRRSFKAREGSDPDAVDSAVAQKNGEPVHLVASMVETSESDSDADADSKLALRKYYLEEMSLSQIGRELGISKEGVRKRLKSALSMVRRKNRHILENAL